MSYAQYYLDMVAADESMGAADPVALYVADGKWSEIAKGNKERAARMAGGQRQSKLKRGIKKARKLYRKGRDETLVGAATFVGTSPFHREANPDDGESERNVDKYGNKAPIKVNDGFPFVEESLQYEAAQKAMASIRREKGANSLPWWYR